MTFDDLKPFIDWMQANPNWAGFITFLISIAESLAVIGLVIPGTIVMGAIGSLVGSGILPSLDIILWASAGAIVGDGLSYWLGYHFHEHIREMWPFRSMPKLLEKGESFFLKHGGKSVFMGRFIGPIRPIIPVIAGMLNMPPWRFTLANVTSAFTWAPAYMLPGYLLGTVSVQLAPHTAGRFLIIVIIALLSLWLAYWITKYFLRLTRYFLDRCLSSLWLAMRASTTYRPLTNVLTDPQRPYNHHQLTLFFTMVISLGSLVFLSVSYPDKLFFNEAIWNLARNLRFPVLDKFFIAITILGEWQILLGFSAGVLLLVSLYKQWRTAWYWIINIVLVSLSAKFLLFNLQISRPGNLVWEIPGWSFPSLHTAFSTAILGLLAVIINRHAAHPSRWYYWTAALLISLISLSRIYLGAVWFTDVLGGLLLGLSVLLLVTLCYRRMAAPVFKITAFVVIGGLFLSVLWASYLSVHYESLQNNYQLKENQSQLNSASWWAFETQPEDVYRTNLLGQPIELLNVQWAGNKSQIIQSLTNNGWEIVPNANLAIILNRIAAKERAVQLPVFPDIYLHHRPIVIMTKYISAQKSMLVLRLWNANLSFTDNALPLWLGTISFHKPWKFHFPLRSQINQNSLNYSQAINYLTQNLNDYAWKQNSIPEDLCSVAKHACSPEILLIKPK